MFKTYFINAEGDECVTGFYLPGEVVPCASVDNKHLQSAVALDTSSTCRLDTRHITTSTSIPVMAALLTHESDAATEQLGYQLNVKNCSAQARFAGFCLLMVRRLQRAQSVRRGHVLQGVQRAEQYIATPMSRTDIASYLGLTLESLSRVMSKMKKAGVIAADRNSIEVLQPRTLSTLALHLT